MNNKGKNMINNVLLVGGTHGNELTGVYLLRLWEKNHNEVSRNTFNTNLLLANKESIEIGKRYVDKDLNRNFITKGEESNGNEHEDKIAKDIYKKYGPNGEVKTDFVVDMHTTTSKMGITIMVEESKVNLFIADKVREMMPGVKIHCFENSNRTQSCLRSISPYAIGLEVGPVGQNIFCHKVIEQTRKTMECILNAINEVNQKGLPDEKLEVKDVYFQVGIVSYPETSSGNKFVVHESLEDKNYTQLLKGDELFTDMSGEIITYDGEDGLSPVFVNEAAYYEKNQAFSLVKKTNISI